MRSEWGDIMIDMDEDPRGDLDRFINGLTGVDRYNLRALLIAMKPAFLEQEGASEYVNTLFTNLIEGVVVESERREFKALTDGEDTPEG